MSEPTWLLTWTSDQGNREERFDDKLACDLTIAMMNDRGTKIVRVERVVRLPNGSVMLELIQGEVRS